ncbi:MAG: OmpA family protein [Candidatus Cyclobacteriaceae bacterium M2_1C_046]
MLLFFIVKLNVSFAETFPPDILPKGYYVVVGAYAPAKEHYAEKFTNNLQQQGYNATYGYSPLKNLLFVYVYYDSDFRASLQKMREMRQKEEFDDTWVYVMGDYKAPEQPDKKEKINVQDVSKPKRAVTTDTSAVAKDTVKKSDTEARKKLEEKIIFREEEKIKEEEEITLEDFLVFVNLYNAANYHDVSGDIQVIDPVRASLIDVIESGSYVTLPDPNNRSGEVLLVCDVFGYRKMQQTINYYNPLPDTAQSDIQLLADIFVVNFDLVRYHVGDIVTMFNVYFFKDAAIMQPKSKYELNQLLEMMKENPAYKIRIHGHTNGRNPGPIIYHGEDENLFALTDDDQHGFGSAKKLSKERATLIKEFLVQNGIDPERMEIKAWGGRRMLFDKHSAQAHKNVRVEIEILEE